LIDSIGTGAGNWNNPTRRQFTDAHFPLFDRPGPPSANAPLSPKSHDPARQRLSSSFPAKRLEPPGKPLPNPRQRLETAQDGDQRLPLPCLRPQEHWRGLGDVGKVDSSPQFKKSAWRKARAIPGQGVVGARGVGGRMVRPQIRARIGSVNQGGTV